MKKLFFLFCLISVISSTAMAAGVEITVEIFNHDARVVGEKTVRITSGDQTITAELIDGSARCSVTVLDLMQQVAYVGIELTIEGKSIIIGGKLNPFVPGLEENYDELHVRSEQYVCHASLRL